MQKKDSAEKFRKRLKVSYLFSEHGCADFSRLCGFFKSVLSNSTEQEMDREARVAAFATCRGPDCLKDE